MSDHPAYDLGLPLSRRSQHAYRMRWAPRWPLHTSIPFPSVSRCNFWTSLQITNTYGTLTPFFQVGSTELLRGCYCSLFLVPGLCLPHPKLQEVVQAHATSPSLPSRVPEAATISPAPPALQTGPRGWSLTSSSSSPKLE